MDCRVLALDIFRGGKPKRRKTTTACLTTTTLSKWFKQLLDELDAFSVTNAYIVMDNAKYHKGLPIGTPTSRQSKKVLLDACRTYGIAVDEKAFKSILWQHFSDHKATIKPAIVQMATEKGHTVVYTPPHHSDLQPIELVSAIVKGHLGHKYTDGTGLLEVKARLQEAFDVLKASSFSGCIKVLEEKLQKLHDHLKEIDAFESDEDSSARSSSDSDN
ncbi:hypothetical protein B5M09_011453 [Aphanomyces astaci]|uniref:Uncharacterized protein n=1 Tax=Aphanomyces astaci TaxID=112090 RepID=A0A425D6Y0_APHAT|nr:hypothetical protein B5M09_011453 [Aphanomyces astaci]